MASSLRVPPPPLSAFVDLLWISESYVQPHAQERLLPTGSMELVFTLDDDGRVASGVSGARCDCMVLDTSRPFTAIGVHFKPGGGFPFFDPPAGDLHGLHVPLDALWGRFADAVRDELWDAKTPGARFRILEQALLKKSAGRLGRHPAVRCALEEFGAARTRSISDVTAQIGLSPRRFIELFRREVGLTPKMFCRIRRFQQVLHTIETVPEFDWADIALQCGYFDQAHFIHDFRAFSGINPSSYVRQRTSRNHVAILD